MSSFYLRNLDFLKKFKNYFVERAQPLMENTESSRFILPECYRPTEISLNDSLKSLEKQFELLSSPSVGKKSLSTQEEACLSWLVKGKTSSEIAEILNLSRRTVENYLANIKMKWDCRKISEVVYLASRR